MQAWIDKASKKIERIAVPSLMKYIVICMGVVYVLDIFFNGQLSAYLAFDRTAILQGEVWRVVSFIFIPFGSSPLFIIFALYFYWMIGEAMEQEWGFARFNLFYLVGVLATIVAGAIAGYATNHFLNMSLFFAFAILFPNFELRLFFLIPVKVKWLAWLDAAYFIYMFIFSGWSGRAALLVSIANLILFFWHDVWRRLVNIRRQRQWKSHFKNDGRR